jgi:hypothetical protein
VAVTNVALGGVGGDPASTFKIYTQTNIATPAALWTPIFTNQFDSYGAFVRTNRFDPAERERCFRLLP